jgi:hypothetical protein
VDCGEQPELQPAAGERRSYTTRKAYRRGALLGGTFVEIVALVVFAVLLCVTSSAASIVPIVLAGGSFLVLFGSAGQAIDELGRYEQALHNVAGAAGFFRGMGRDVVMSFAPRRTRRRRAYQELKDQRSVQLEERLANMSAEQRQVIDEQVMSAALKARNWLIVVGGSAILLIASIKAAVG